MKTWMVNKQKLVVNYTWSLITAQGDLQNQSVYYDINDVANNIDPYYVLGRTWNLNIIQIHRNFWKSGEDHWEI